MKLKHQYVKTELGSEVVAVPVGEGDQGFHGMIRLNETAAFLFERLEKGTTEEALLADLKATYDAPEGELREAMERLLQSLRDEDLLS